MTENNADPSSKKKRVRRPAEVQTRILDAGIHVFATRGFDGTSTRQIAEAAHVSPTLLLYHFKNKLKMWQAVIDHVMSEPLSIGLALRTLPDPDIPLRDQLLQIIRAIVQRFAQRPELQRLMTLEAHRPSERLSWLCDKYLSRDYEHLTALIVAGQKAGLVRQVNPGRLRFAIIAMAAVPFSVAAEYEHLTGRNPSSVGEIESTIELIELLVLLN